MKWHVCLAALLQAASSSGVEMEAQPRPTLIYTNAFAGSPADWAREVATDWVMEGRGLAACSNGCLSLSSEHFTVPRDADGHFNFWLKRDFPANVAFEWEFRYPEPGPEGLAIAIWAARGKGGESIFDPRLPARLGVLMSEFTGGDLNCYHTSYFARGRKTANLRKNAGFHLIATGHELSTVSRPDEWHVVRVEQFRGVIRLLFDGKESYRHTDTGAVGGRPIETGGAFGFRQQNNVYRGEYRNFRVHELR